MGTSKFPEKPVILIDDEEAILFGYQVALTRGGVTNTTSCCDSTRGLAVIDEQGAELVLLDLTMPEVTGEELLEGIAERHPGLPVIIVTGNDDINTAVKCMRKGAYDYLVKPVAKDRLLNTVRHVLAMRALERENELLKKEVLRPAVKNAEAFSEIITASPTMQSIFSYIEAIAATPHPVLLTGETGVGKELFARAVHKASGRPGELVAVNVSGLDDNVFADTLFGHLKGAYTGADTARKGMIEAASGGTLFLDEIGDLSLASQVKLLRLLQEREYFPLGQDEPVRSDARIIVATNVDLAAKQESGGFRADLYYRLHTHHVRIPPLRERMDDLPVLVESFLKKSAELMGKKKPTPPAELIPLLRSYSFPGNIRELEAMVSDAVGRHTSKVMSLEAFSERIIQPPVVVGLDGPADGAKDDVVFGNSLPPLKDAKGLLIDEAMRRANGNMTQAAKLLGTTRQALSWHVRKKTSAPE